MNVRNLKEMFERQTTVVPPPNRPIKKISQVATSPVPPQIQTPQIAPPHPHPAPPHPHLPSPHPQLALPPQVSFTLPPNNFLQQLNSKLARNSRPETITEAFYNKCKPCSDPEIPSHKLDELNMDEIINSASSANPRKTVNTRYGISEKQTQKHGSEKTVSGVKFDEKDTQDMNFSELLQRMRENQHQAHQYTKTTQKQTKAKSKIFQKYDYAKANQNNQSRLKRIDFVMNVVFGKTRFEFVPSNLPNKQPEARPLTRNSTPINPQKSWDKRISSAETQPNSEIPIPKVNVDIHIGEIVQGQANESMPSNRTQTLKRPSMVSPNFMNELAMRIKQKQQTEVNKTKQELDAKDTKEGTDPGNDRQETDVKYSQKVQQQGSGLLTPRQIKKQKKKQSFDDY